MRFKFRTKKSGFERKIFQLFLVHSRVCNSLKSLANLLKSTQTLGTRKKSTKYLTGVEDHLALGPIYSMYHTASL